MKQVVMFSLKLYLPINFTRNLNHTWRNITISVSHVILWTSAQCINVNFLLRLISLDFLPKIHITSGECMSIRILYRKNGRFRIFCRPKKTQKKSCVRCSIFYLYSSPLSRYIQKVSFQSSTIKQWQCKQNVKNLLFFSLNFFAMINERKIIHEVSQYKLNNYSERFS